MPYFTYLLTCRDGTIYAGSTNNLEKRLKQHNGLLKGGAKYTIGRRPVSLSYVEEYSTKSEALKREIQLKQLSKKQKIMLFALDR